MTVSVGVRQLRYSGVCQFHPYGDRISESPEVTEDRISVSHDVWGSDLHAPSRSGNGSSFLGRAGGGCRTEHFLRGGAVLLRMARPSQVQTSELTEFGSTALRRVAGS